MPLYKLLRKADEFQ
jgi:hypothetical protein